MVRSADMPRMSGLCSSSAAMNLSASVLTPRSTTSKPAPSSIIPTRFLPMSWMSPLTVPMTTLPIGWTPVSTSSGRRIAIPAFIALAARSTSGTNRMPSRKSIPTIRMPSTSAVFSTCSGDSRGRAGCSCPPRSRRREAVVEVVVHLRGQLLGREGCQVDADLFVRPEPRRLDLRRVVAGSALRNRAV